MRALIVALGVLITSVPPGGACAPASRADRTFVATVLQGGGFEVAAGKLAAVKGSAADIRDLGNTEQHDHALVGAKLRALAVSDGFFFGTKLHPRFRQQLTVLAGLSGTRFDDAFLAAMDDIHAKDGAAFAREAKFGSDAALRRFAAETFVIVERHLGALHATDGKK